MNKTEKKIDIFNMSLREKTLLTLAFTISLLIIILIASYFIPLDSLKTNFASMNKFPSLEHIFGTDWLGRDMFTVTIKGLGLSIFIGLIASVLSAVIATIMGVISGINDYADTIVTWLIDFFLSIPHILFIIIISIGVGGGAFGVILGVMLTHWTSLSRIIRAEIKQLKTMEYIKIAEQMGKSKYWIATKHLIPNIIPKIILGTILLFPHAIMHEATVTFLGFGLQPHEPAIGIILSQSMSYLSSGYWWLTFLPGLALVFIVLLFDIIGDNLGKLLDPKTAQE